MLAVYLRVCTGHSAGPQGILVVVCERCRGRLAEEPEEGRAGQSCPPQASRKALKNLLLVVRTPMDLLPQQILGAGQPLEQILQKWGCYRLVLARFFQ